MIQKIAILGAGTMGRRIAQFFAQSQLSTIIYDSDYFLMESVLDELQTESGALGKQYVK